MREIILDTETTGLNPEAGHRIIEIGCVEMVSRTPTGKQFHRYLNPERDVPEEVTRIHGLVAEDLANKEKFAEIADELLEFLAGDRIVIHNVPFDLGFLNAELSRAGRADIPVDRTVDSLLMARSKFPGQSNSLDALCRRFNIAGQLDRTTHGALLDAKLLAEVYIDLTDSRMRELDLTLTPSVPAATNAPALSRPQPMGPLSTEDERQRHRAFLKTLDVEAIWNKYLSERD